MSPIIELHSDKITYYQIAKYFNLDPIFSNSEVLIFSDKNTTNKYLIHIPKGKGSSSIWSNHQFKNISKEEFIFSMNGEFRPEELSTLINNISTIESTFSEVSIPIEKNTLYKYAFSLSTPSNRLKEIITSRAISENLFQIPILKNKIFTYKFDDNTIAFPLSNKDNKLSNLLLYNVETNKETLMNNTPSIWRGKDDNDESIIFINSLDLLTYYSVKGKFWKTPILIPNKKLYNNIDPTTLDYSYYESSTIFIQNNYRSISAIIELLTVLINKNTTKSQMFVTNNDQQMTLTVITVDKVSSITQKLQNSIIAQIQSNFLYKKEYIKGTEDLQKINFIDLSITRKDSFSILSFSYINSTQLLISLLQNLVKYFTKETHNITINSKSHGHELTIQKI